MQTTQRCLHSHNSIGNQFDFLAVAVREQFPDPAGENRTGGIRLNAKSSFAEHPSTSRVIKHIIISRKTVDFARNSPHYRTTIAHFLNHGKWDDEKLENIVKTAAGHGCIGYEDLIAAGICREIAGRVNRIVKMAPLSVDDYKSVLRGPVLDRVQESAGCKVNIDGATAGILAERASACAGCGPRSLTPSTRFCSTSRTPRAAGSTCPDAWRGWKKDGPMGRALRRLLCGPSRRAPAHHPVLRGFNRAVLHC